MFVNICIYQNKSYQDIEFMRRIIVQQYLLTEYPITMKNNYETNSANFP